MGRHEQLLDDQLLDDQPRIHFLQSHLEALAEAIAQGVAVHGYFVWSLLDNFEWDSGYDERFGLVYVDYATLQRTPKHSFRWYQSLIERNGF